MVLGKKIHQLTHWPRIIPKRYYVILLLLLCFLLEGYVMRSISVVMIAVTSDRKIVHVNKTEIIIQNWVFSRYRTQNSNGRQPKEVRILLGIDAIGSVFSSFAGIVTHKLGGVTLIGIVKFGEAILTLSSPLVIDTDVRLFIANRFVLGFFKGLEFIGFIDVLARWVLPNQRVRVSTFTFLALNLGLVTDYLVAGSIIHYFGWRNLYYITGAFLLVWSVVWITFVGNDPSRDRFISEKEKQYLSEKINCFSNDQVHVPYKQILTSVPVLILLHELFISFFIVSFMELLPLYVKDVYDANIITIGLISSIPEFSAFIVRPFLAYFADRLRSNPEKYSIGKIHKLFLFWGQSATLVFFFVTAIWNNLVGCIVCLTLARIAFGLSTTSYNVIVIDVAGQYAGFVQSLTGIVKSLPFLLNPFLIGWLIPNHTQSEWNVYFLFIGFSTLWGVIIFMIFGPGELQTWAKTSEDENNTRL